MARYKYTQESGIDFKVNTTDKCDSYEDSNEVRQILDDLGELLGHSKFNDLYPKDATSGGDIDIRRITTKSAVATLTTGEAGFVKVSAAAGYTLTLPTAVGNKLTYIFVKTDANTNLITIDGAGTETINGALTYTDLNYQYAYVAIRSDNANWFVLFRSTNNIAITTGKLSQFAATTSAELAGVISDETGTLKLVYSDSPTFTTNITTPIVTSTSALSLTSASNGNISITPNGSGQVKLGGVVELTNQSGCSVYQNIYQRIPTATWIKLIWENEEFDYQNEFDSTYLTGNATATTASHLIDTTLNQFTAADVGKVVYNTTDFTYAIVTAYNSTSDLTIDTDIMANTEGYGLYFSRFTATKAGVYLITGQPMFTDVVAAKSYTVSIKVNGLFKSYTHAHSSLISDLAAVFAMPIKLSALDYVEIWVYQSSGNTIRIYAGAAANHLVILKIF